MKSKISKKYLGVALLLIVMLVIGIRLAFSVTGSGRGYILVIDHIGSEGSNGTGGGYDVKMTLDSGPISNNGSSGNYNVSVGYITALGATNGVQKTAILPLESNLSESAAWLTDDIGNYSL